MYKEYFDYYLELERDFFTTEPYVTIDEDNFNTFSVQYNRIYQSICSEIDCLLKEICRGIVPENNAMRLSAYCAIIQKKFSFFNAETVCFNKSRIVLQPWIDWSEGEAPKWWTCYNKVKHHRLEKDSISEKINYKNANLENVLNALAALYIVEQYYLYNYDYSKEIKTTPELELNPHILEDKLKQKKANTLEIYKSRKCYMKRWQEAHCYMGFLGQEFFELDNLYKIM